MQWACFQGFAPPGPLAESTVANRKEFAKPLKIRPRPLNAIDVILKRMPVTEGMAPYVISMLLMFCYLEREPHGPLRYIK